MALFHQLLNDIFLKYLCTFKVYLCAQIKKSESKMKLLFNSFFLIFSTISVAQTYCSPTFTSGCVFNNYISYVNVGGLINSATGCTVSNYTSMTANITSGFATPMTVTCAGWDGIAVWIDLNNDGDFTDPGELLYNHYQAPTPPITYNFNITVPPGTIGGLHRMRIMCGNGGSASSSPDPCKTIAYGNFHDYTVNIPPSLPNDAGISSIISPVSACAGSNQAVEVEIKNFGTNQITSAQIKWTINNLPQATYNFSGLLDTANGIGSNTASVIIGNIILTGGNTYNIVAWTELPNSVIDSANANDTSSKIVEGYLYPVVSLGNDTVTCPNDLITLNAGVGHDSIRWGHGPTSQYMLANSAMTYIADVWENACKSSDSIAIGLFPSPPAVNIGNDTTICLGDILLLDATASGVTYLWQDNTMNSTLSVDTSGQYWVVIEDINNCKNSDTIEVSIHSDPSITLSVSPGTNICFGTPVIFNANGKTDGSEMYQLVINNVNSGIPQSSKLFINPILKYADTVRVDLITDQCEVNAYAVPSNSFVMILKPMPRLINGITSDTVIENTKKNYAVPNISGNSYLWRVNGGKVIGDSTFFAVQVQWDGPNINASVSLIETDNGNCSYENILPVNVISIVGVENKNVIHLGDVYPNPSNSFVTIPVRVNGNLKIEISLYDITGKKIADILNGNIQGKKEINYSTQFLNDGIYFLKISSNDGQQVVKKLSVKH